MGEHWKHVVEQFRVKGELDIYQYMYIHIYMCMSKRERVNPICIDVCIYL